MPILLKKHINIMLPPQATKVLLKKDNITIKVNSYGLARELVNSGWIKL